jgi:hypothetical protein
MKNILGLITCCLMAMGCSDTGTNSNVFESQVESINKAEEVEQQILDAAAMQRQAIEENVNP